jgi:hypothetical protein
MVANTPLRLNVAGMVGIVAELLAQPSYVNLEVVGLAHKRELKALAVRFNNNARQLRATYACCGTVWRRTT